MPDIWTPYQFDLAVTIFGTAVDNKLEELDERTSRPKYRLSDILAEQPEKATVDYLLNKWKGIDGAIGVRRKG